MNSDKAQWTEPEVTTLINDVGGGGTKIKPSSSHSAMQI